MNVLIKQLGTPRALVWVGEEPLLFFPTNQRAWDYLSGLLIFANATNQIWPEEVYIAFAIDSFEDPLWVSIPQIQKVVREGKELKYESLFGSPYEKFCRRIKDNWPSIKKGLKDE
jgi:hypothetical protein